MRHCLILLVTVVIGFSLSSTEPVRGSGVTAIWSSSFGDVGYEGVFDVGLDSSDNIFVIGDFYGTISIGGNEITATTESLYLAKLDANGANLWSKSFASQNLYGLSTVYATLAVDAVGNVVIAGALSGNYAGTIDFGGGPLPIPKYFDNASFIAKFSADGQHLWSKTFCCTALSYNQGLTVVGIDSSNNIVITGPNLSSDFPWFDGIGGQFAAKLDPQGNVIWSHTIGPSSVFQQLLPSAHAIDKTGAVIIAGTFRGTKNFGTGPVTATGVSDIFVLKLDASGIPVWNKTYTGAATDSEDISGVVTDSQNAVWLAVGTNGTLDLGSGPVGPGWFFAKLSSNGDLVWTRGLAADDVHGILAIDDAGNLVGAGAGYLGQGIAITKFNTSGQPVWQGRFGQYGAFINAGALDRNGNAVVAGIFGANSGSPVIDFGNGPLTAVGASDVFLAKLGDPPPPPPVSHRKVIFIQGIVSGTDGQCDGVRNRTKMIRDYLTSPAFRRLDDKSKPPLTESDFVYFDYSPDQTGCQRYDDRETCTSIDNGGGSGERLANLIYPLIAADEDVEIDIVAHSMGGLLTGYWLSEYGDTPDTADPTKRLYERVKSILLVDSAPEGFVDGAQLVFGSQCFGAPNGGAPSDMIAGSAVTNQISTLNLNGVNVPKLYAIDAYPGMSSDGDVNTCDVVPANDRMSIGNIQPVGGNPKKIWARSHGVAWTDGFQPDGGRNSVVLGLHGFGAWIQAINTDGKTLHLSNISGISQDSQIFLHCSYRRVAQPPASNNVVVDRPLSHGDQGEIRDSSKDEFATVELVAGAGITDPLGLGDFSRFDMQNYVGCAISHASACGANSHLTVPAGGSFDYVASAPNGSTELSASASQQGGGVAAAGSFAGAAAPAIAAVVPPAGPSLRLVSPTGRIVDGTSAGAPDVVVESASGYERIRVLLPEPGDWSVVLDGIAAPGETVMDLNVTVLLDLATDPDQDAVSSAADNCPLVANVNQADTDDDAQGDPCDSDDDGDGLSDTQDNCSSVANSLQSNFDADTEGDACDVDDDGDDLFDDTERVVTLTNPLDPDTDDDGHADAPTMLHVYNYLNLDEDNCPLAPNTDQLNLDSNHIDNSPPFVPAVDDKTWPNSDATGDACDLDDDNDGISDANELSGAACGGKITDPLLRDSDGDSLLDGAECAMGFDPTVGGPGFTPTGENCATFLGVAVGTDTDGDKIKDYIEFCFYNTLPNNTDTDGDRAIDGAKDGCEAASFNPDRIVNVADMGMLATAISNPAFRIVNVDVNKDGVWNTADQGIVASFISPAGQCP